jgi:DNA-binding NarL/FixJ family response regulator
MIRLAITDDSRPVRDNFERTLSYFEDLNIVWTAADGDEAVKNIASLRPRPDLILMDIEMRRMNGVEATRRIREMAPEVRILMLTIFEEEDHIFNAIRAGAAGYLLKDERPARIHQAILDAHEGRMPMSPLVAAKALEVLRNTTATLDGASPTDRSSPEDYQLTAREVEILAPLAKGKTYSEIATSLFISPNTVRRHIENIYRKLAVNSKVEASNLANKHKWFE